MVHFLLNIILTYLMILIAQKKMSKPRLSDMIYDLVRVLQEQWSSRTR